MSDRELDAQAIIQLENIGKEMQEMRTSGKMDEDQLTSSIAPRLKRLYSSRVENSLNSQLVEQDISVFSSLLQSYIRADKQTSELVLDNFDGEEFEKVVRRKIAAAGSIEKHLKDISAQTHNRFGCVATIPRYFTEPPTKVRGPRVRVHREQGPAKQTIEFDEKQQQNQEAQAIREVKIALRDYYFASKSSIGLYEFALNRGSFSQTVENLFYLSFLVRDFAVKIHTVNGEPLIRPLFIKRSTYTPPSDEEDQVDPYVYDDDALAPEEFGDPSNEKDREQYVSSLTYDFWLRLRQLYPRDEPMIPSRREADECEETLA